MPMLENSIIKELNIETHDLTGLTLDNSCDQTSIGGDRRRLKTTLNSASKDASGDANAGKSSPCPDLKYPKDKGGRFAFQIEAFARGGKS